MEMQSEDFLKLCKLPVLTYRVDNAYFKGDLPTRGGLGTSNVIRVITDWFPEGSVIQMRGSTYVSRGAVRAHDGFGMRRPELHLLDPKTLEVKKFSVLEALGLAQVWVKEQIQ